MNLPNNAQTDYGLKTQAAKNQLPLAFEPMASGQGNLPQRRRFDERQLASALTQSVESWLQLSGASLWSATLRCCARLGHAPDELLLHLESKSPSCSGLEKLSSSCSLRVCLLACACRRAVAVRILKLRNSGDNEKRIDLAQVF